MGRTFTFRKCGYRRVSAELLEVFWLSLLHDKGQRGTSSKEMLWRKLNGLVFRKLVLVD